MEAIFESDPIFQTLRQLYLNGANRERNEPGFYDNRKDDDDEMLADILLACKKLLPLTPEVENKGTT